MRKESKMSKFKEKLDMYDMIVANLAAKNAIIETTKKLNNSQIEIGFSNVASETQITKYFMFTKLPDYMRPMLAEEIRRRCAATGVKINVYFYSTPHAIHWDSAEMANRMSVWSRYSKMTPQSTGVFNYRSQKNAVRTRARIIKSTMYLNEADLEYKRKLMKVSILIEITAKRDRDSIENMTNSVREFKTYCKTSGIKVQELRVNMIDWLRAIGMFSLKTVKGLENKIVKTVMTDDILANLNSFKQGRIGKTGVTLGNDILNGGPAMRKFKENPNSADNWLVAACTDGGKSFWIKVLDSQLLVDNFVTVVMDYEGDEYNNMSDYIKAGRAEDSIVVSMGKSSTLYCDPCQIPDLTGDNEVDKDLKDEAINFIIATFKVIICELDGTLSREEERILSLAIQRMYDTVGVTSDRGTWHRSKGLKLKNVYEEIKRMVESSELVDMNSDNLKHKAAIGMVDAASIYFEEGESKSGTFANPIPMEELYKAKFIVFSFGMKGAGESLSDPKVLALKQLSVAYVNIQISNYCKYVKHCFNVKIWEEFQRWGGAKGSAEVILNVITGGRKRGDVNFIATNDLAAMLDDDNKLTRGIRQNIQNYAIGCIKDNSVIDEFCDKFSLKDIKPALHTLSKAGGKKVRSGKLRGNRSIYKNAFCIVLDSGERAIVKATVPEALAESKLFKTGVEV